MILSDVLKFSDDDTVSSSENKVINDFYDYDQETINHLKLFFNKRDKVGKDSVAIGTHSFMGTKIISSDKVCEVAKINAVPGVEYIPFISISFKSICERDIKILSKSYMHINSSKPYPFIVEKIYMLDPKYAKIKIAIMDQFF